MELKEIEEDVLDVLVFYNLTKDTDFYEVPKPVVAQEARSYVNKLEDTGVFSYAVNQKNIAELLRDDYLEIKDGRLKLSQDMYMEIEKDFVPFSDEVNGHYRTEFDRMGIILSGGLLEVNPEPTENDELEVENLEAFIDYLAHDCKKAGIYKEFTDINTKPFL